MRLLFWSTNGEKLAEAAFSGSGDVGQHVTNAVALSAAAKLVGTDLHGDGIVVGWVDVFRPDGVLLRTLR